MSFDPQAFIDASITDALDTKITPCPTGEFMGIVDKVLPRQWVAKEDPTKSGVALDVLWLIEDAGVKAELGRDSVIVKQGLMLDIDSSGRLDTSPGKNVPLGRLRAALNLNEPGQAFSFSMLPGQAGKVIVSHRASGEDVFAEIKTVTRL